ncbi:MAG TPA: hypothetical protein VFS75_01160 [Candidatus Paceibacterota bacterium]|nr:hypothetical protein [Candidatus Paceibacterota bacterium]
MMRTTTPILSILIAVLLFVFFTQPQYLKAKDLMNQIDEYHQATKTYADFTGALENKLAKKSDRSPYEMERLDQLVPEEIDDTQDLVDLEALAQKNNLLFQVTEVDDKQLSFVDRSGGGASSAATSRDELTTVDISFAVVGTYDQFKSFLKDLEKSLTIYEVTQLSLTVAEGPFQQFKMTVRTYALPNK